MHAVPKLYPNTGVGVRGIVAFHGSGGTAAWVRNDDSSGALLRLLAQDRILVTSDAGGVNTWGNDAAIVAGTALRTRGLTLGAKSGKVILVGISMGALNAFCWAAANPMLVSAIVAVIPICDVNDVHANNLWGLAATINAAYGGSYIDAAQKATHNPTYFATVAGGSMLANLPVRIYYSSGDTIARPTPALALASAIGASASTVLLGSMDHSDAAVAAVDEDDLLAFVEAHQG